MIGGREIGVKEGTYSVKARQSLPTSPQYSCYAIRTGDGPYATQHKITKRCVAAREYMYIIVIW